MMRRRDEIWSSDWPALCLMLRSRVACDSPIEEICGTLNLQTTGCGVQVGER